jgi:hypothetical protein
MNHRQMAGRLQNASRGTSADQLAQSNHSDAQSLACRNIHCFPTPPRQSGVCAPPSVAQRRHEREDGFSIEIIPRTRTKIGAREIANVNSIFRISSAACKP